MDGDGREAISGSGHPQTPAGREKRYTIALETQTGVYYSRATLWIRCCVRF